MVPIVPAEAAEGAAAGPDEASWEDAPPVRKQNGPRDQKLTEGPPPIRAIEPKTKTPGPATNAPVVKPPAEPVPPEISPLPFHTSGANRAQSALLKTGNRRRFGNARRRPVS